MVVMLPAEIRVLGRGRSRWVGSAGSRTRSNTGSRAKLRTLAEGVEDVILSRKRRRGCRDSFHTSGIG